MLPAQPVFFTKISTASRICLLRLDIIPFRTLRSASAINLKFSGSRSGFDRSTSDWDLALHVRVRCRISKDEGMRKRPRVGPFALSIPTSFFLKCCSRTTFCAKPGDWLKVLVCVTTVLFSGC